MDMEENRSNKTPNKGDDDKNDKFYALLTNIPNNYHSKDLRSYFSFYVENNRFDCFHFRHRPQPFMKINENDKNKSKKEYCCIIRFNELKYRNEFINDYHSKLWTDNKGNIIPLKCLIFALKIHSSKVINEENGNVLSVDDLKSLIELNPPTLMPHGNVGTPSEFFRQQIRLCKLPPSIIAKLGLQSTRSNRKFGAVPLEYDCTTHPSTSYSTSRKGDTNNLSSELCVIESKQPHNDDDDDDNDGSDNDNDGKDSDNDNCEEWERYEANYDDVTEQDRTKPKKYEEELEITWEKGGAGLVWYTDTFYWKQLEDGSDCDWKWADDWDVDYSIYYSDYQCTSLDAKSIVEIREDQQLRCGNLASKSCFKAVKNRESRKRRRSESEISEKRIGDFEKHTKGIGSSLMKKYGWKMGMGLGVGNAGRLQTICDEMTSSNIMQNSFYGFGYHGEKLHRKHFIKHPSLAIHHHIRSIYDKIENDAESEQSKGVMRRDETDLMKYR